MSLCELAGKQNSVFYTSSAPVAAYNKNNHHLFRGACCFLLRKFVVAGFYD
jgi:hypothetical protein